MKEATLSQLLHMVSDQSILPFAHSTSCWTLKGPPDCHLFTQGGLNLSIIVSAPIEIGPALPDDLLGKTAEDHLAQATG